MGGLYFDPAGEWWRFVATPFMFDNAGYQFVALVAVAIFGTLVERRFGWLAVLIRFSWARRRRAGRRFRYGARGLPRTRRERRGARTALRVARGRPPLRIGG